MRGRRTFRSSLDSSWSKEEYDSVVNWNQPLLSAISQFSEFKADPNDWVAKALDTETNQVVVISPPLPQ
jgi:hypothetical protein